MKSDLIDIEVYVFHRTEKAALIENEGANSGKVWVPLSVVDLEKDGRGYMQATLPKPLAEEKGLA